MRRFFLAIAVACLGLPAWSALSAEPGVEAERVSGARSLESGHGVVVISVRSEIYLDDPLQVYFLREGGSIENDADVIRFERRQGFFAFGNDTVKYKIRAYQVPEGTYRLVGHGMNCPKVPAEDERCLADIEGLTGSIQLSRPSRGYGEDAPTFEVRGGSLTYAGDFALTSRNTIEWSAIPLDKLSQTRSRFGRLPKAPDPAVPEEFKLKYGLFPREYEDDMNRRY